MVCASQPGLALIVWGQQLSPTQPSLRCPTAIMITCSNSPGLGSGMPNHYVGDLLHTMAISGFSRVRTELLHFGVVPSAPPHPVQLDCQLAGHGDFGDLAPAAHGQVKELAAPLRIAAHRDLGGF